MSWFELMVLGVVGAVIVVIIIVRVLAWNSRRDVTQSTAKLHDDSIALFRKHTIPDMKNCDRIIIMRFVGVNDFDALEKNYRTMRAVSNVNEILFQVAQQSMCVPIGQITLAVIIRNISSDNFPMAFKLVTGAIKQYQHLAISLTKEEAEKFFAQSNLDTAEPQKIHRR